MISDVLTKENTSIRVIDCTFNLRTNTVIQEGDWSSQESLKRLKHWLKGMFRVSFSIGSSKVREQHQRFRFMLEKFLDGWDGTYINQSIPSILLASATFLSLMGTLRSALITILEEGLRCLERRLRVAFCIRYFMKIQMKQ